MSPDRRKRIANTFKHPFEKITVSEIAKRGGFKVVAWLYADLVRLEREGTVGSEWIDSVWPRRRLYSWLIWESAEDGQ